MSTEMKTGQKAGIFMLPLLTAAPIIAGMLFVTFRYGNTIRKLINILIKLAVTA